jgi:heat-inducible transcriptional repressor
MPERIDISPIESEMLDLLVDLHIETGSPVSSRTLQRRFRIPASTAQIRGILHRLEEKGYLFKPHVSAGRVPSDSGYRHYVDGLGTVGAPGRHLVETIRTRLGRENDDVRDVMMRTSRLIGELTSCMGLMVGVPGPGGTVGRLRIVQREGSRGLVVIEIRDGRDRSVDIDLGRRHRAEIISRAAQIMNERIAGYPLEEAHERLLSFLREGSGSEREIAAAVAAESTYLFSADYNLEYYFDGIDRSSMSTELTDPRVLTPLVRLMGRKNLILEALRGRFGRGTVVTIGRENRLGGLEELTLVTRALPGGACEGLLGVIGPMRMSYRLVLTLLDGTARELQRPRT